MNYQIAIVIHIGLQTVHIYSIIKFNLMFSTCNLFSMETLFFPKNLKKNVT